MEGGGAGGCCCGRDNAAVLQNDVGNSAAWLCSHAAYDSGEVVQSVK